MSDMRARIGALPVATRAQLVRQLQRRQETAEPEPDHYDVAVLGGGVAGLTVALQLRKTRPGVRVLVVEGRRHPAPEAAHKVGESTVEIASRYLRDVLGLEEHLDTRQLRKFGLRMFFSDRDNTDLARRTEMGPTVSPPLRTYQLDRGRLENALADEVARHGIEFLDGTSVTTVTLQPDRTRHRVRIADADGEREILARWVVDATGRRRLLQRQLQLSRTVGHAANAVWFRVGHPVDIKQWTDEPDWSARVTLGDRAMSTNHLMGPGYWVWLIRLASGSTSIGIVTDANAHPFDAMNRPERALEWLHRHEPQCADEIERCREKIQDFRVMKDYSYSSRQVFSGEGRWCLTGEAGVFLDPLYSPGLDMIAIGNGLIVDLVHRSLDGEDVRSAATVHDSLFLTVADIWLAVYEGQYTLLGSPRIMIPKVVWDTAFYWGVFGLLYFHDRFRTLVDSPAVAEGLARVTLLSNRVQAFFREWQAIDRAHPADDFVDLYSPLNFMVRLHGGMAANLSGPESDVQFAENVRLLEQLAGQLVSTVIEAHASRPDDGAVFDQIQRWQTDPLIAELIATHRRDGARNPTSEGWLTHRRHAGPATHQVTNTRVGA